MEEGKGEHIKGYRLREFCKKKINERRYEKIHERIYTWKDVCIKKAEVHYPFT
jgi:hypothetical protein